MRIVSLLPSATEIVCELGLGGDLVGVTHECDHPPFVAGLPRVTRTLVPHDAASREIDSVVQALKRQSSALATRDVGKPRARSHRANKDRLFVAVCVTAASVSVLVLLVLLTSVFYAGWSKLTWQFLTGSPSRCSPCSSSVTP